MKLHHAGPGYHHVPTLTGDNDGIFSKLRYWGLIESRGDESEDGNKWNGWWRITELGTEFVLGNAKVMKTADTYNQQCFGLRGPMVDIHWCLRNQFNYNEMVLGIFREPDDLDDEGGEE